MATAAGRSAGNQRLSLVLVGTPIGNLGDLSSRAIEVLRDADVIACEDTRHTRKLLTHAGITGKRLLAVHEHNETEAAAGLIALVQQGQTVALVTDAGMPGISDPGQRVVAAAVESGVEVDVVPGPSAALAALVLSGLPTDRFTFEGFLPRKGADRRARLAAIAASDATTVLYESPRRVAATLAELPPDRAVAVVRELTKLHQEVWRGSAGDAAAALAEPRGEYVIVVAPAPASTPTDITDDDILAALAEAGDDRKAAIAAVAKELGVPKRRVYALAQTTRSARSEAISSDE
jgi:16S rRNA (cytidine1402-2'-O)-methyltransferase